MSATRILVAADESAIRIVRARTLQRAGFEVVVANDGQDALAIGGLLVAVGELCGNAIKHAYEDRPGEPIRLSARPAPGALADRRGVVRRRPPAWDALDAAEPSRLSA